MTQIKVRGRGLYDNIPPFLFGQINPSWTKNSAYELEVNTKNTNLFIKLHLDTKNTSLV